MQQTSYDRRAPFGYRFDEETQTKVAIPEQLAALEKAKDYLAKGSSMAKVRDWLVTKTNRKISIPGMLKTMKYASRKTTEEPT